MDLSIILVNYNTCQLTLQALDAVFQSNTTYQYEVILVDNHSTDGSAEQIAQPFPQVRLIRNSANLGFSKANNQAIRSASGRYILLLNTDTVIEPDTLQLMIDFMDKHENVGASGCKILLPDGSLDETAKRGFPTPSASLYYVLGLSKLFPYVPKFNKYKLNYLDPDHMHEVDSLVGAFMMVRSEAIAQVGMMDEAFFMYGEDIDWCYRIKMSGWNIVYTPITTILHYKGASSRKQSVKLIYEFHRAMVLFYKKHYVKKYPLIVSMLVYSAIFAKMVLALLLNMLRKKAA